MGIPEGLTYEVDVQREGKILHIAFRDRGSKDWRSIPDVDLQQEYGWTDEETAKYLAILDNTWSDD